MASFFTYHNHVQIDDGNWQGWAACKLTTDTVLFAGIEDTGGGINEVVLRAGQKNGSSITLGSKHTVTDAFLETERMVLVEYVEDNKALCLYLDEVSSKFIRGVVVTSSGLTLSNSSPTAIVTGLATDGDHQFPQLVNIQTGEFLLVYRNSASTDVLGRRIVVSGTTITVGNALTLLTSSLQFWDIYQLTPGKIVLLYDDGGNVKAKVLSSITNSTFSDGTAITLDTGAYWPTVGTSWNQIDAVNFMADTTTNQRIAMRGITESGTNLTAHTAHFASYFDDTPHQDKLVAANVMNNVGLLGIITTYPNDRGRLFEFNYDSSSKQVSLSYGQILTDGNVNRFILTKLNEALMACTWYDSAGSFKNMFITSYLASYFWGVWQGGMGITYLSYGGFSPVYLGTHVANQVIFTRSYHPYTEWTDLTDNLLGLSYNIYSAAASYVGSWGATYAAVRYQRSYTNVRAIGFI